MSPERLDELIALAALGELSEADSRELDAAAEADPFVAAELAEALAAASSVQALRAEEPPSAMRDAVLDRIRAVPQEPAAVDQDPVDDPVSLDRARTRRRGIGRWVAAAAAVLALVAGGVVIVSSGGGDGGDVADDIADVLEADDAEIRTFSGELPGTLTVVFSDGQDAVVVAGDGLPVPVESRTYELWLVGDDGATSAGRFVPTDDGSVEVRFDGIDPTGFVLGVTEEPAGGSPQPTPPILATA